VIRSMEGMYWNYEENQLLEKRGRSLIVCRKGQVAWKQSHEREKVGEWSMLLVVTLLLVSLKTLIN
jgi:hypothetical protein